MTLHIPLEQYIDLSLSPFTKPSVIESWNNQKDQPLLPPTANINILPHDPTKMEHLSTEIAVDSLQPVVNAFIQVMWLEWLLYEADLRKLKIMQNMHQSDLEYNDIQLSYINRYGKRVRPQKLYRAEDKLGMQAVKDRQAKIKEELSRPARVLVLETLKLGAWIDNRDISAIGNILKYAWDRTDKNHLQQLFPRFPMSFKWDWM